MIASLFLCQWTLKIKWQDGQWSEPSWVSECEGSSVPSWLELEPAWAKKLKVGWLGSARPKLGVKWNFWAVKGQVVGKAEAGAGGGSEGAWSGWGSRRWPARSSGRRGRSGWRSSRSCLLSQQLSRCPGECRSTATPAGQPLRADCCAQVPGTAPKPPAPVPAPAPSPALPQPLPGMPLPVYLSFKEVAAKETRVSVLGNNIRSAMPS